MSRGRIDVTPGARQGRLITIEGIDGSGKSTLARALASAIASTLTTEPTRGPHGTAIREAFAAGRRMPRAEERRLFELDRRTHMDEFVKPRLEAGETIVSDRSYYSSAAYQGTTAESAVTIVRDNEVFAVRPDVVVYLDLPPELALARIRDRGEGVTAMETLANLTECAARYEAIWASGDLMVGVQFIRIDAAAAPNDIVAKVIEAMAD